MEYIPRYVTTPKGVFRPIERANEAGTARSDTVITEKEEFVFVFIYFFNFLRLFIRIFKVKIHYCQIQV